MEHLPGIIAEAAKSPLGILALALLVVAFVGYKFFGGPNTSTRVKLIVFFTLVALSLASFAFAFYGAETTIEATAQTALPVPGMPSSVPAEPPTAVADVRRSCGTAWSDWTKVGGAVGNPCPGQCRRGDALRETVRMVGFPPRPQIKHEFQCWR